jgi:hypothetical protein
MASTTHLILRDREAVVSKDAQGPVRDLITPFYIASPVTLRTAAP